MSEPAPEPAAYGEHQPAASTQPDSQLALFDVLHVLVSARKADRAVYSKLRQCSRGARDWVLKAAPQATLTLRPPDAGEPLEPWQALLTRVQTGVATRGGPASCAVLILSSSTQPAALDLLLSVLAGVQSLTVQPAPLSRPFPWSPTVQPDRATLAALVQRLVTGLPGLHTLDLQGSCLTVPDPGLAPHVTSLKVIIDAAQGSANPAELQSLSRYLNQVTALEVRAGENHAPELWPRLFTTNSTTLTKFTNNTPLRDGLLSILMDRAPGLKELSVRFVELASDTHATKEWKVHKLTVQQTFVLGSLHRLPVYRAGRVQVHYEMGRLDLTARDGGFEPDTWSRLDQWCFLTKGVTVVAAVCKSEPDALRAALHQLKDLQALRAVATFDMWSWDAQLLQILAAAWPTLTHLTFGTLHTNKPLTDDMLAAALTMTDPLITLAVPGFEFKYDNSDCTWPWHRMSVTNLDVLDLLNLPSQTGAVRGCTMRVLELDFHGVEQEHVEPLKAWLTHVQWEAERTAHAATSWQSKPFLRVHISDGQESEPEAQAACALAQLSALKAFRWRKQSPKVQAKVTLNLPLTQDVMQGLPALPAWSGTLVLDDATWPLPPTDYTTLVQHIPTSYNRWELGEDIDRHSELFKCIAAGVNATRRALGLGPLTVVLPGYRPRQYGKRELEEGTDVRIEPARGEGY